MTDIHEDSQEPAQFGKPKNRDYLLQHNELLSMFRDFRCPRYREGVIDKRKAIASIVAAKVSPQATSSNTNSPS